MKNTRVVSAIALGSNKGNRMRFLRRALAALAQTKGVRILNVSSVFQTEPVGGPKQKPYLNAVAKVAVRLRPLSFLAALQRIEKQEGRIRESRWGPRTLDLDILTWGSRTIRLARLKVPHPRYAKRRFVLVPFCEIDPHFVHPVLRKRNRTLLRQLTPIGQRVTIWSRWKRQPSSHYNKRKPRKDRSPR